MTDVIVNDSEDETAASKIYDLEDTWSEWIRGSSKQQNLIFIRPVLSKTNPVLLMYYSSVTSLTLLLS